MLSTEHGGQRDDRLGGARLAAATGKKPAQKLVVSDVLKKSERTLEPGLRLGDEGLRLAQDIVAMVTAAEEAEAAKPAATAEGAGASEDVEFETPADVITVVHDKYEFRIPSTGFFFNENDVWVQTAGTRARVGISDYMQQQLTDITYVEPPEVGVVVEQFGEVGTVESTKATFELVSPVSGTVVRVNEAVEDMPEAINEDPYANWIAELELSAWEEDRELLIDGAAYAAEVERKAGEY